MFVNVDFCGKDAKEYQNADHLEDFLARFEYLLKHNDQYFTIVIEDLKSKKIVGAGTIFVERKFVHHNGNCQGFM
jgi:hypothetical protein